MNAYVQEAVDFLKSELQGKGPILLRFSGGKDSIVSERLLSLSGLPYHTSHSFTGIDAPEVIQFIRKEYPRCVFVRPRQTFWHLITTKNPPANFSRWCCTELKKKPAGKIDMPLRVLGQRAEESTRRGKYPRINTFKKTGQIHHYPILGWKEWQVWEFIEEQGLKYPELYDCGFDRLGCVICPYHSSPTHDGHALYRDRWPKHFEMFEKQCTIWFHKRKAQGRDMFFSTPEEFIFEWYRGNVRWYKTEGGALS